MNQTIITKPIGELTVHAANHDTYGDTETIQDLIEGIQKSGIIEPLVITKKNEIISGQRRFRAAQELQLTEVPVRVCESEDEHEILLLVLEHNRQRVKTKAQLAAEAHLWKKIESEKAALRKNAARSGGDTTPEAAGEKGKARDKAGEALGMSGRTVDKAAAVHEAKMECLATGKTEDANKIDEALNKGFETGLKEAKKLGYAGAGNKKSPTSKRSKAAVGPVTSTEAVADATTTPTVIDPTPPDPQVEANEVAMRKAQEVLAHLQASASELLDPKAIDAWGKLLNDISVAFAQLKN